MEFLMTMLAPPDKLGDHAPADVVAAIGEYAMRLASDGKLRDGRQLREAGFRVDPSPSGQPGRVIDGPFAETKELVGGYFVVECESIDEARAWLQLQRPHCLNVAGPRESGHPGIAHRAFVFLLRVLETSDASRV